MLDRRRCTAVLALALSLLLLPAPAAAGPPAPEAGSESGFLSSWLSWLAGGWRALAGSGETALGGLWEPSGVGIDPNGGDAAGGTTTSASPTSPPLEDGSISTVHQP